MSYKLLISRLVAEINPPRGNKRPNKATTLAAGGQPCPYSIHKALVKLSDKYDEFFAEYDSSEQEEDVDDPDGL